MICTHAEFMKYKSVYTEIHPSLIEYCHTDRNNNTNNNNNNNHNNNHQWRTNHVEKVPTNWLMTNKLNRTDDDKLYAQLRSILNKLSDSNFDELTKEIITLNICKTDHLVKVAELIFSKAIVEKKFNEIYAKLAKNLNSYFIMDTETNKPVYFRELLINRCQNMFTSCISSTEEAIRKDQALGCLRFIGELYNYEMLTSRIIQSCFGILFLKLADSNSNPNILEYMRTLITIVGAEFTKKCRDDANAIFDKMNQLIKSGTLSNRDKFGLMDIIDLKNNNKW